MKASAGGSSLNRWLDESDLDDEDLAKVAVKAIEAWLDEDIVGFEQDEGQSTGLPSL